MRANCRRQLTGPITRTVQLCSRSALQTSANSFSGIQSRQDGRERCALSSILISIVFMKEKRTAGVRGSISLTESVIQ